jgi:hypothetical protein
MHHTPTGIHEQLGRQRQQALLDDARSTRQSERPPRHAGARLSVVTLVALLAVGGIGVSHAKAATTRPEARTLVRPTYLPGAWTLVRPAYLPAVRMQAKPANLPALVMPMHVPALVQAALAA